MNILPLKFIKLLHFGNIYKFTQFTIKMTGVEHPEGDFEKFKQKVAELYGDLELLAKTRPEVYAHQVLSHGFMDYCMVNSKRLDSMMLEESTRDRQSFNKGVYTIWAIQNNIPEELARLGWEEYLLD